MAAPLLESSIIQTFRTTGDSSQTDSVTVDVDTDCLVLELCNHKVYTGAEADSCIPSAVTYDGVSMTLVKGENLVPFINRSQGVSIWYLKAPATGANNLVITWAANFNRFSYSVLCLSGVDATLSIGQIESINTTNSGLNPKLTMYPIKANSFAAVCCIESASSSLPSLTPQSSTTELQEQGDTAFAPESAHGQGYKALGALGATEVGWNASPLYYSVVLVVEFVSTPSPAGIFVEAVRSGFWADGDRDFIDINVPVGCNALVLAVSGFKSSIGAQTVDIRLNAATTTYDGDGFAVLNEQMASTTNRRYVSAMYYLANPSEGNNTLHIDNKDNNTRLSYMLYCIKDADTASLIGATAKASDTSAPVTPNLNLTTTGINSLILGTTFCYETADTSFVLTAVSNWLKNYEKSPWEPLSTDWAANGGGSRVVTTAALYNVGWTCPASVDRKTIVMAEINAVAAAGGVTPDHIVNACINRGIYKGIQSVPE